MVRKIYVHWDNIQNCRLAYRKRQPISLPEVTPVGRAVIKGMVTRIEEDPLHLFPMRWLVSIEEPPPKILATKKTLKSEQ